MKSTWTDDELRWYLDAPGPKYCLGHWWEKEGEIEKGISPVDRENPLLTSIDSRNRPKIRLEPWLWEVLRRHPQLFDVRKDYQKNLKELPEIGFEDYNCRRISILQPWEGRGQQLIECLAFFGHLPWAVKDEEGDASNKQVGLSGGTRDSFKAAIPLFASASEDFCKAFQLTGHPMLTEPKLTTSAEESEIVYFGNNNFRQKSPLDYTIAEYRNAANSKGREILLFEVNKGSSPESVAHAVKEFLMKYPATLSSRNDAGDQSSVIRLNWDDLNLLAGLDSNEALSSSEWKRIRRLFSCFKF